MITLILVMCNVIINLHYIMHMYIYIYIERDRYLYLCIYIYTYMCICTYIYIYTHIYICCVYVRSTSTSRTRGSPSSPPRGPPPPPPPGYTVIHSFIHGAAIGARSVRRRQRVVGLLAGLRVLTRRPSPPSCGSRNVSLSAPASLR